MLKSLEKYGPPRKSAGQKLTEGAAYAVASYGYGYAQNRWRASVGPVPLDLAAGIAAKAGALVFGRHLGSVGGLVDVLGNAGIGAFCHTLGSGAGSKKSGVRRLLVNEADLAKVKAVLPNATVLGEIGPAPHGDYLTHRELSEMAQ